MRLWVLDFRGVSDKEKEMERWRPAVARRLWVESGDGDEALHHGTVRQRDRNEKARESLTREKMRKKMNAFFFFLITVFLIFFNTKRKSQNDIVLAHLTVVDN